VAPLGIFECSDTTGVPDAKEISYGKLRESYDKCENKFIMEL
jgi:hypothetical protein